jgi:hypothetical protein
MSEKTSNQLQANRGRRNTITLVLLLLWVVAVFTYSIFKFAKVIN